MVGEESFLSVHPVGHQEFGIVRPCAGQTSTALIAHPRPRHRLRPRGNRPRHARVHVALVAGDRVLRPGRNLPAKAAAVLVRSVAHGDGRTPLRERPDEVWIPLVEMRLSAKPIRLADERSEVLLRSKRRKSPRRTCSPLLRGRFAAKENP